MKIEFEKQFGKGVDLLVCKGREMGEEATL